MTVVKISGLDTVLADNGIMSAVGFKQADRSVWLGIYKGTQPSRLETITNIDTFHASDLLWSSYMTDENVLALSYSVGEPLFVVPTATGKATWFLLAGVEDATRNIQAALIGDTAVKGNIGDLVLSGVDFVKGSKYRVRYLQIVFPYSFTY